MGKFLIFNLRLQENDLNAWCVDKDQRIFSKSIMTCTIKPKNLLRISITVGVEYHGTDDYRTVFPDWKWLKITSQLTRSTSSARIYLYLYIWEQLPQSCQPNITVCLIVLISTSFIYKKSQLEILIICAMRPWSLETWK